MLNRSHALSRYKTNGSKNKKKCLIHFDSDARVFVHNNWHKIQLYHKFFSNLHLFDSFFSIIVWSNRLHVFDGFDVSVTTAAMKMGKRHFYSDHSNGC